MPDKYQEEIEEILRGLGEKAPSNSIREPEKPPDDIRIVSRHAPPHYPRSRKAWNWPSISSGKLALLGLIVLLLGALWLRPLIWVGLGFLVAAYLLFFIKPRSFSYQKRWRGTTLEDDKSAWDRFKSWIKS
jgi:hypothetical protein